MTQPALILIVDDDDSVRRSLERLIKADGHSVRAFASAENFLAYCPECNAVCLLLDVMLPGMSGLELQRRLSHENRRIPVIFISGSCEDSVRDEALRIGATAFMTKPFADDELLSAVRSALG